MIIDTEVEIIGNGKTINHYLSRGYNISVGDKIFVKIIDLIETSSLIINCLCDFCNEKYSIKYYNYIGNIKRNNSYRCNQCAKNIRSQKIKSLFKNESLKEKVVQKRKITCLNNLGVDNPLKSKDIKDKIKETNLEKYGVDNPMKSKLVKISLKNSILEKYRVDHYSKTSEFKCKYKKTCFEKYGVNNVFQAKIYKDKIKETNYLRYGVSNPIQNEIIFEKAQRHSYKIFKYFNTDLTYQGTYELDFLNYCFSNNIKIEKGPCIDYNFEGKSRKYFSDFFIKSLNLICEIKSTWTFE